LFEQKEKESTEIAEEELQQEEVPEEDNDESKSDQSGLLETALIGGAGTAALLYQSGGKADQPGTKPAETTTQPSQESTLTIQTAQEQPSSVISSFYNNLQSKAAQNPVLFYNALKNPSKNLAMINSQTIQNELNSIANDRKTVVYLPSEALQDVLTTLGFTQIPQLKEQWAITTPMGTVTVDFLAEQKVRIIIPTQLLITKTDEKSLKQLTIQNTAPSAPSDQLPVIVFGLPVQKTTVLTIGNKSIVAANPSQLGKLITQLFFELLEKGKKEQEIEIIETVPQKSTKKQKISPGIRGLPTIPEIPEIASPKPKTKPFTIKITQPPKKMGKEFNRPDQKSFISPRITSPRLPDALKNRINKPPIQKSSNIGTAIRKLKK
jgi:hypothetical protein